LAVLTSALVIPLYDAPACERDLPLLVAGENRTFDVQVDVSQGVETPEDIADRMALVEASLADVEEAPPGSMVEDGWTSWEWVPGTGFVRG
jgi:hypothetical protein